MATSPLLPPTYAVSLVAHGGRGGLVVVFLVAGVGVVAVFCFSRLAAVDVFNGSGGAHGGSSLLLLGHAGLPRHDGAGRKEGDVPRVCYVLKREDRKGM